MRGGEGKLKARPHLATGRRGGPNNAPEKEGRGPLARGCRRSGRIKNKKKNLTTKQEGEKGRSRGQVTNRRRGTREKGGGECGAAAV